MNFLIIGVLIWSIIHFLPVFAPALKGRLSALLGEGGYKGTFSLIIAAAIGLMIYGWRHTDPQLIYALPGFVRHIMMSAVLLAMILFAAANGRSRLRKLISHPMLTGMAVWAGAHLLVNGDNRSVVLFGGLGLWALISIFGITFRDRAKAQKVIEPWSWGREARMLAISIGIYGLLIFLHPWFTGMQVF